ncbi:hypothetical protein COO60DRAFT_1639619 [Scenedesmus sp. NREL 46B-D3]|nr:hypothetical protein COO60DRAFT_1639619 [Scenedesmus sp. NREL 46B-D3]
MAKTVRIFALAMLALLLFTDIAALEAASPSADGAGLATNRLPSNRRLLSGKVSITIKGKAKKVTWKDDDDDDDDDDKEYHKVVIARRHWALHPHFGKPSGDGTAVAIGGSHEPARMLLTKGSGGHKTKSKPKGDKKKKKAAQKKKRKEKPRKAKKEKPEKKKKVKSAKVKVAMKKHGKP